MAKHKSKQPMPIGRAIMRTKSGRREVVVFARCAPGQSIRKLVPQARLGARVKDRGRTLRFVVQDKSGKWYAPNHSVLLPIENGSIANVEFYRDNKDFLYCARMYEQLRATDNVNPDLILKMAYDKHWEMHAIARANGVEPGVIAQFLKHRLKREPKNQEHVPLEGLNPEILEQIREG